jgi:hypothetical protein
LRQSFVSRSICGSGYISLKKGLKNFYNSEEKYEFKEEKMKTN